MIIIDNFIYYLVALIVSLFFVHNVKIRIEQRIGLSENYLKLLLRSLHGIFIKLPLILLLFLSSHIVSTYINVSTLVVFISLFIMMLTLSPYGCKRYGFITINTATFVSIIIVAFTGVSAVLQGINLVFLHNPFTFFSFLIGILLIAIINNDEQESLSLNVSRTLSFNIFLVSLYIMQNNFIYTVMISVLCVIVQYIIKMIIPKLNVHKNMEYSLSIVLTATLICFVSNIIWLVVLDGKSLSLLFRI